MTQNDKDAALASVMAEKGNVEVLKLHVHADLYRAFQRCSWVLVNETGKNQIEIMNEMVRDFLIKHGC